MLIQLDVFESHIACILAGWRPKLWNILHFISLIGNLPAISKFLIIDADQGI